MSQIQKDSQTHLSALYFICINLAYFVLFCITLQYSLANCFILILLHIISVPSCCQHGRWGFQVFSKTLKIHFRVTEDQYVCVCVCVSPLRVKNTLHRTGMHNIQKHGMCQDSTSVTYQMFVIFKDPTKTLMENVVTTCGLGGSSKLSVLFFFSCTAVSGVCKAWVSEVKTCSQVELTDSRE